MGRHCSDRESERVAAGSFDGPNCLGAAPLGLQERGRGQASAWKWSWAVAGLRARQREGMGLSRVKGGAGQLAGWASTQKRKKLAG